MPNENQSDLNFFSLPFMDRCADKRRDGQWIAERLQNPQTRFVVMRQGQNLFCAQERYRPLWLDAVMLEELGVRPEHSVFLGRIEGRAYFAVDLIAQPADLPDPLAGRGVFQDLRKAAPLMEAGQAAPLAYAKALFYWRQRHRFCGVCGQPTRSADSGHLLVCTNPSCTQQHFPRIDPAVIVLVFHDDQCLLGRQAGWPQNMYATIAGFVEPGETLESAVAREVLEETGITLKNICYHSSQPWPFPGSIMLGFRAQAASTNIRLDGNELEEARWFTRPQIRAGLWEGSFSLPSRISISYRLIESWFDECSTGRLGDIS